METPTERRWLPTDSIVRDILIAPNRGEEPKPMQRIASGCELSRIAARHRGAHSSNGHRAPPTATLVFDESDAGHRGRVAEVVGKNLKDLARAIKSSAYVICRRSPVLQFPFMCGKKL